MKKKTGNLDAGKQKITTFIGSIIGVLQGTEQMLVNVLNEAEQSTIDSMNNVMSNLNNAIAVSTRLTYMILTTNDLLRTYNA